MVSRTPVPWWSASLTVEPWLGKAAGNWRLAPAG